MKSFLKKMVPLFDLFLWPAVLAAAGVMRLFRRLPPPGMKKCTSLLEACGVYPILAIYREPLFRRRDLWQDPAADRVLPGLDLNTAEQLRILRGFHYRDELAAFPLERADAGDPPRFYYHNQSFESGDAEYLYCMIRRAQPARLFEIGSGFSTLVAQEAIRRNRQDRPAYRCRHVCIEPFVSYWNHWLDRLPVEILRERVERVPARVFAALGDGDILFIDSSHIIRPQGDVLREFLDLVPRLAPGVWIHVHDVYTPRDYQYLRRKEIGFSNEQYLLEALLTRNPTLKITGALNYLARHYPKDLAAKLPVWAKEATQREIGSFWMRTVRTAPARKSRRKN